MIAILGNHDVAGVALGTGLEVFAEAGLLTLAKTPAVHQVAGVSIACLPWAPVSRIVAAAGGGDRDDLNAYAAELLLATARGLLAQVDGPAVLLVHFAISGSALPNGLPVDQMREPVLDLGELEALGFDAIVAGHVHLAQRLRPGEPAEFYVGSPMPLNFGEAGNEHGVWLLEVDPGPLDATARFIPIESRPLLTLDSEPAHDGDRDFWVVGGVAIVEPVKQWPVDDAIVKVRIRATAEQARRLDVAAFKRALYEAGAHKVFAVQLEIEKPERARVEGLTEELDEQAALELWLEAQSINGTRAAALRERTERYLGAVRA